MRHLFVVVTIAICLISVIAAVNLKGSDIIKKEVELSKIVKNNSLKVTSIDIDMSDFTWTDFYESGWQLKGTLEYTDWSSCESEKDDYRYRCDFFTSEPTKSEITTDSGNDIDCSGNSISLSTYTISNKYYACIVYEDTTKNVVGFKFSKQGDDNPTTQNPTTGVPTTQNPTTGVPTTQNPTTGVPTTQNPTTGVPTTQNPTTGVPTTQNPTTGVPTTAGPSPSEIELDMTDLSFTGSTSLSVSGTMKYVNWDDCSSVYSNYRYKCEFSSSVPTKDSIGTDDGKSITCSGTSVYETTYSTSNNYFGCIVYNTNTQDKIGFAYIVKDDNPTTQNPTTGVPTTAGPSPSEIELDMTDLTFNEGSSLSISGTMKYVNWDDCSSVYSNYRYQCTFSSSPPTKDSIGTDDGKSILCYGNSISESTYSTYNTYFGCVVFHYTTKNKIGFGYITKGDTPTTPSGPTTPKPTTPTPTTLPPTPPPPQKPSLVMSGVKMKLSGSSWNAEGNVKYEWKTCVNESSSYKLYCNFFNSSTITADIFNKTEPMSVKCEGNEIKQSHDGKDYKFLGCLLTNSTEFEIIGYIRGYTVTTTEYVVIGVICGGTFLYVIVSIMYMARKCKKERKNKKKKTKKSLLDNEH